ncbi:MAG: Zn-ribbon domain-containing OB-fold protein [Rhodospirillaceae bacterium]|nr:Zn-ribbon domain-containing OB-fold protein [Rhodospirillaceae bacterium]
MDESATLTPGPQFMRFLDDGRILLQRSRATGRIFHYPRVAEPGTGSTDLDWVEVSGRGRVYSTTVIRRRPPEPDRNIALIDLDEGPRLLSRVEDPAPDQVHIGMRVQARIVEEEAAPLIVFVRANGEDAQA